MNAAKADLRELARRLAASLPEEYIAESDRLITEKFFALAEERAFDRIFIYCSVKRECDTRRIIEAEFKKGTVVALPVAGKAGEMHFARYTGELRTGAYGIPVPTGEKLIPAEGDIVVVPSLCCDESCSRLGHGGGYYDRALSGCESFTLGFCRERLMRERIPVGRNDVPLSAVLTEKRLITGS